LLSKAFVNSHDRGHMGLRRARHGRRPSRPGASQSAGALTVLRAGGKWSTCSSARPARRWSGSAASAIRAGPPMASLRTQCPPHLDGAKRLGRVPRTIIENHRQAREQLAGPRVFRFSAPRPIRSHSSPDRQRLGELGTPPVELPAPPGLCSKRAARFTPPAGALRPGCGLGRMPLVSCWWHASGTVLIGSG